MTTIRTVILICSLAPLAGAAGCRPQSSPTVSSASTQHRSSTGEAVEARVSKPPTAVTPSAASATASPTSSTSSPTLATTSTYSMQASSDSSKTSAATTKVVKTDAEWRAILTPKQYNVLREKGTERAFTGDTWDSPPQPGEYRCAACDALLFKGTDKFVSDCGWPAFDKAIKGSIHYHTDRTFGMTRTEVTCARCDGHLGHVFEDGPKDTTGVRYCINSVSIKFKPDTASKDLATEAITESK